MTVDSRIDTYDHIQHVQRFLSRVIIELLRRSLDHDASKLISPEKEACDTLAERTRADIKYGSEEYKAMFRGMRPAIQHHYAGSPHHPEHYPRGIRGMSLVDLVEMLCDWKAAALRHNGDVRDSMDHNQARFGFSDELKEIFLNTLPMLDQERAARRPADTREAPA